MKALPETEKDSLGNPSSAETERLRVGVVIITCDRPELLRRSLLSVVDQKGRRADKILIVDGSSSENALPEAATRHPTVEVMRIHNVSIPNSRNRGWRACKTDIIAFTDDDCEVPDNWIEVLAGLHEECPRWDAVGGPVVNAIPDNIYACAAQTRFPGLDQPAGFVYTIPTSNLSYKRTTLQSLGGFDEAQPRGEDTELNWRLTRGGGKIYFEPSIPVRHYHRATLRSFLRQQFLMGRAFWHTRRKWPDLPGTIPDTGRQRLALAWAVPVDVLKLAWRLPSPRYGKLYAAKKMGQVAFNLGLLGESMKLQKKQSTLCPNTGKTRSRPL